MKEIIHIWTETDITLCGCGSEELDDYGTPNQNFSEEEHCDFIARTKYKCTCRYCQKALYIILCHHLPSAINPQ
jgi:hypothetical protein